MAIGNFTERGADLYDAGFRPDPVAVEPQTLSDNDRHSPVWLKIEKYLAKNITNCRKMNDEPLSELETSALRGKIGALKEILALGSDQEPEDDPESLDIGY